MDAGFNGAAETIGRGGRDVEVWDLSQMTCTETCTEPAPVVRARESSKQRERIGGQRVLTGNEENRIRIVAGDLDGYGGPVIRDLGQRTGLQIQQTAARRAKRKSALQRGIHPAMRNR